MLAYYIHDLSPFLIQFSENFGLRWYGLAYVLAFASAYGICLHLARRGYCDIPPRDIGDFITGTALFGVILGGRLGYMLFYDWQNFLGNPLVFFKFWDGGMSSHGGILGIVLPWWERWARRPPGEGSGATIYRGGMTRLDRLVGW